MYENCGYAAFAVDEHGRIPIAKDAEFGKVLMALAPYADTYPFKIMIEDCFGCRTISKQELKKMINACKGTGSITKEQAQRFKKVCEDFCNGN